MIHKTQYVPERPLNQFSSCPEPEEETARSTDGREMYKIENMIKTNQGSQEQICWRWAERRSCDSSSEREVKSFLSVSTKTRRQEAGETV